MPCFVDFVGVEECPDKNQALYFAPSAQASTIRTKEEGQKTEDRFSSTSENTMLKKDLEIFLTRRSRGRQEREKNKVALEQRKQREARNLDHKSRTIPPTFPSLSRNEAETRPDDGGTETRATA